MAARPPLVIRRKRGRLLWRILQAVVLVLYAMIIGNSAHAPTTGPLLVVTGVAVGLLALLELIARWRGRVREIQINIDGDGVRHQTGGKSWEEPISAYEGVLWHEEVRRGGGTGGGGSSSYRVWMLDLKHREDPDRNVRILERRNEDGVRARWEAVAADLGLPALRELADGRVMRREVEDLDASLRDLAVEGRLEGASRGDETPPESVEWNPAAPRQARVRQTAVARVGLFALSLFPALGGIIAYFGHDQTLPLVLLAVPLAGHFYRTHAHYRIDVADDTLLLSLNIGGLRLSKRSLPLGEIEQVWTKPVFAGDEIGDLTVVVESDQTSAKLSLLSAEAGQWVAGHIRRLAAAPPAPGSS